jgi:hypothetical protein
MSISAGGADKKPAADFAARVFEFFDDGVMAVICPTRQIFLAALSFLPHEGFFSRRLPSRPGAHVYICGFCRTAGFNQGELAANAGVEFGRIPCLPNDLSKMFPPTVQMIRLTRVHRRFS